MRLGPNFYLLQQILAIAVPNHMIDANGCFESPSFLWSAFLGALSAGIGYHLSVENGVEDDGNHAQ